MRLFIVAGLSALSAVAAAQPAGPVLHLARPVSSFGGFFPVGANDGSIAVAYARDSVWLFASSVWGPFAFHTDLRTMASWADSAAAVPSGRAARLSYHDGALGRDIAMELGRPVGADSAPVYQYLVNVGKWQATVVLPFDSAQRLFALMHMQHPEIKAPPTPQSTIFFDFQVEKQAQMRPESGQPKYPEPLRAANIGGEVLAQFIIDTTGLVEIPSFKVLVQTNPWFVSAVWAALPSFRFDPAQVKGQKVRELVQQPYAFNLTR